MRHRVRRKEEEMGAFGSSNGPLSMFSRQNEELVTTTMEMDTTRAVIETMVDFREPVGVQIGNI